nr:YgjP-like metallopeptidase domain-containing protein [Bacillus cereus group sp. BfR-BA-01403]
MIEPNHTSEFWNIVSIQVPQYLKAKKWLKQNGYILEVDF